MNDRLFAFVGGNSGTWRIAKMETIIGQPIPAAAMVDVVSGRMPSPHGTNWVLRGVTSNERYEVHDEKEHILAKQPSLGRPQAVCAARKHAALLQPGLDHEHKEIIMKQNVGGIDRTGRIVLGVVLLVVGLVAPIDMTWRIVALVIAAVALVTAIVRFCPANWMLGINTCESEKKK